MYLSKSEWFAVAQRKLKKGELLKKRRRANLNGILHEEAVRKAPSSWL